MYYRGFRGWGTLRDNNTVIMEDSRTLGKKILCDECVSDLRDEDD
jgi:hypothetical protein